MFKEDLKNSGLAEKTIKHHVSNARFYINEFLIHYEPYTMEKGPEMIFDFLGDFYIRKCLWSTPSNIKATAASIKKFYKCMMEHNKIPKENYDELCLTISGCMETWQELCAEYNDPDGSSSFFDF